MIFTGLALSGVLWFFHWTVLTGGGFQQPGEEDYYNFLVRGWRQGHLYMAKEPSAAFLALKDPYDPAESGPLRLGDASYFKGHHYLYFGPAPAVVLLLPYGIITGQELGSTSAIFVFCSVGFLAASALWLAIRRRFFPRSNLWVGPAGVMMLGLGTHVLALQRRPLVWELPIATGYAFLMLTLLGLYKAIHGRRPLLALAASGSCLGLAVAARPTFLLSAIAFLPVIWLLVAERTRPSRGRFLYRYALLAGGTLGFCVMGVLAHNFARFGNPLEFGQNYQLSMIYESKVRHFSPTYLIKNLHAYFIHPGNWSWKFPFVEAVGDRGGPDGYAGNLSEGVCGLAVTFPYVWCLLALPCVWSNRDRFEHRRLSATIAMITAVFLSQGLAIHAYFLATPRYMADFAPALALLSLLGLLGWERQAQTTAKKAVFSSVAFAACLATAVAGILVSFDYHGGLYKRTWPEGFAKLEKFVNRLVHHN